MPSVKASIAITVSFLVGVSVAAAAQSGEPASSPDPSACPSPQPVAPAPPAPASEAPSVAASPAPSPAAADPCGDLPATPAVAALTVEAGDLWFSPPEIELSANGTTTLTLVDTGFITHNFTVDELDLLVVATPRGSGTVEIIDPPPGTYEFYCSISGHREAGMSGTLIVG